jgi:hypothetical protein
LGCVATNRRLEGVKKAYAESIEWHLEAMRKDKDKIPKVLQGEYELVF